MYSKIINKLEIASTSFEQINGGKKEKLNLKRVILLYKVTLLNINNVFLYAENKTKTKEN